MIDSRNQPLFFNKKCLETCLLHFMMLQIIINNFMSGWLRHQSSHRRSFTELDIRGVYLLVGSENNPIVTFDLPLFHI